MATASLTKTKDGISLSIKAIATRGKAISSYLNRYAYPKYQQAQIVRWQTENASEGDTWASLTPAYLKQKKKKFAAYPGAGNATMVATGRLAAAAQGRGPGSLKLVTNEGMTVGVDLGALPYAQYPGVMRPFMEFSDQTISNITDGIAQYIIMGKLE
jgi:hypothetical protein